MRGVSREYAQQTGRGGGFKGAGGLRTAKQSIEWLALMKEELGASWLNVRLFRLGASLMLVDIERQLEFRATGMYSAEYRHPIAQGSAERMSLRASCSGELIGTN